LDEGKKENEEHDEKRIEFEEEDEEIEILAVEESKKRILTSGSDPEIGSLWNKWKRGKLILQPDFQRYYVWDPKKASRLIESMLMSVPLPIIYLSEDEDGKQYVIDGQQRLTSFFSFLDGEFPDNSPFTLRGLEVYPEYNRKQYSELPEKIQDKIMYYQTRVITILPESNKDIKFEIFTRLNTGSMPLNDMELRNCVYRGPYMRLLKKMSENKDFRYVLNISEPDKRMKDVELVLRFSAFYHETYLKYKPSMRKFFHSDMDNFKNISEKGKKDLETAFSKSTSICRSMFGKNAFKRFYIGKEEDTNGYWERRKFNASLYDVMMGVFCDRDKNQVFSAMDSLREGFIDLMTSNQEFIDSILISTSSKQRVTSRFDLARKMVDDILKHHKIQPRCFTRKYKEQLYITNPTCAICHQRINDVDDAAVDHIEQYWIGGKTICKNARLTHRFCNNARSRND